MRLKFALLFTAGGLLLGACATPEAAPKPPPTSANALAVAGMEDAREGLPAQELKIGECGLFLWTRREDPQFVFFSRSGEETAEYWFQGAQVSLNRTALGGDIFGQQLTEQDFADASGKSYQLRMTPGDMLVSGQRVPEASMTITDSEGWKTLIPLAGVTACQPAP